MCSVWRWAAASTGLAYRFPSWDTGSAETTSLLSLLSVILFAQSGAGFCGAFLRAALAGLMSALAVVPLALSWDLWLYLATWQLTDGVQQAQLQHRPSAQLSLVALLWDPRYPLASPSAVLSLRLQHLQATLMQSFVLRSRPLVIQLGSQASGRTVLPIVNCRPSRLACLCFSGSRGWELRCRQSIYWFARYVGSPSLPAVNAEESHYSRAWQLS